MLKLYIIWKIFDKFQTGKICAGLVDFKIHKSRLTNELSFLSDSLIIPAIVERCPDWEEIRMTSEKKVKAVEGALVKLGEFVMMKQLQGDKNQVFQQVYNP